jgi:hypothetical protein
LSEVAPVSALGSPTGIDQQRTQGAHRTIQLRTAVDCMLFPLGPASTAARGQGADPGASTGASGRRAEQSWPHAIPRDAECGDKLFEGDDMKTEAQSHDRDRRATIGRFPLALYVVAELLCTGALVVWVVL